MNCQAGDGPISIALVPNRVTWRRVQFKTTERLGMNRTETL